MEQPVLGMKIAEIRNQKGITQKELSESCNIDIRTIQRIESGDVFQRMSTLKLIAISLEQEIRTFKENDHLVESSFFSNLLLFSFLIGIVNFTIWFLSVPLLPKNDFMISIYLPAETINALSGMLLYWGIFELGRQRRNIMLKVASVIVIIWVPLFFVSLFIPVSAVNKLIVSIVGANSIILGIGFLKSKSQFILLYKIAGMIQILTGPFFIAPIAIANIIGCWLSIPYFLVLLIILYKEYLETKSGERVMEVA